MATLVILPSLAEALTMARRVMMTAPAPAPVVGMAILENVIVRPETVGVAGAPLRTAESLTKLKPPGSWSTMSIGDTTTDLAVIVNVKVSPILAVPLLTVLVNVGGGMGRLVKVGVSLPPAVPELSLMAVA